MRFKNFTLAAITILSSAVLTGCPGMSSGSPFLQISFPAAENLIGVRGALPVFPNTNTLPFVGTVYAYSCKEKIAEIYPNETIRWQVHYQSVPAQIPLTVIFHDDKGKYRGVATKILNVGPGSVSASWIIHEGDVSYFGQRLAKPPGSAPVYDPSSRTLQLPQTDNMESWLQIPNDTQNDLVFSVNGQLRARVKSGELWSLRAEMVLPGNITQPVLVEVHGFAPDGTQLGTAEFQLSPQSWGIYATQYIISPYTLRYQ